MIQYGFLVLENLGKEADNGVYTIWRHADELQAD